MMMKVRRQKAMANKLFLIILLSCCCCCGLMTKFFGCFFVCCSSLLCGMEISLSLELDDDAVGEIAGF